MTVRTVGVEEEFLLVDRADGRPRAIAAAVLRRDDAPPAGEMEAELQLQQIETNTEPCTTIDYASYRSQVWSRWPSAGPTELFGSAGAYHGAVLLAALVRGLVDTAAREWAADRPAPQVRVERLRLASWRASRYGITGELLDPRTLRPSPAHAVLNQLVAHVREALEAHGDYPAVQLLLGELLRRGNGAQLQRAALARTGRLAHVVADAVRRTCEHV
jgi:carboxylate-amine ligase